ncbi:MULTISPECIES: hypothetical protein [Streptomyces]|uniref:hypothetical protein n=1 Tax=Streptomyces TaxID=1883 RepID=UPI0033D91F34
MTHLRAVRPEDESLPLLHTGAVQNPGCVGAVHGCQTHNGAMPANHRLGDCFFHDVSQGALLTFGETCSETT